MAKLLKGIMGGISGKVGNVVGGTWKGIDYLRSFLRPLRPLLVFQLLVYNYLNDSRQQLI